MMLNFIADVRKGGDLFHALSGADHDISGRFTCKGKLLCWKTFIDAAEDTITALKKP